MGVIAGKARSDKCTKMLIPRLDKNSIAVIKHRGLDLVAAEELKNKHIRAVVNFEDTITIDCGREGADYLLKNGINIYEVKNPKLMDRINDDDDIKIMEDFIYINKTDIFKCIQLKPVSNINKIDISEKLDFIENTIGFMKDEMEYFTRYDDVQSIEWDINGKDILIVCRGRDYLEDLKTVKEYIKSKKPLIVGVDGGANAIYEAGLKCDAIVGDMDSVSDKSLLNCSRIFVHTYSDGSAPGLSRVKNLDLSYQLLKLKGTSEDAAVFLCHLKGASTIYLIGGHTSIEEFVEKGRIGMGSTMLLRMMLGTKIVDLKGISKLEKHKMRFENIAAVIAFLIGVSSMLLRPAIFENLQAGIKAILRIK